MRPTEIAAFAAASLAIVFMVVALTTPWALETDNPDDRLGAFATQSSGSGFLGGLDFAYSSGAMDDVDGIGLVRAGGVMLLIALGLCVVGAVGMENQLIASKGREVGAAAGGLGALLWLVGVILLAVGLGDVVANDGTEGAFRLITGFWMGLVASLLMLGATITTLVQLAKDSGFKLELADAEGSFD